MVEVEDGGGGYLRKERFENRRVRGYDGLEDTQRRNRLRRLIVRDCLGNGRRGRGVFVGIRVPNEVLSFEQAHGAVFAGPLETRDELNADDARVRESTATYERVMQRRLKAAAAPIQSKAKSVGWVGRARSCACKNVDVSEPLGSALAAPIRVQRPASSVQRPAYNVQRASSVTQTQSTLVLALICGLRRERRNPKNTAGNRCFPLPSQATASRVRRHISSTYCSHVQQGEGAPADGSLAIATFLSPLLHKMNN
jgi:hypothetical protein